jgi:hypothetical protein
MKKKKMASKRPKKRPTKKQQMIVLADNAGNYYELPRATIERARVSDQRKQKLAATVKTVGIQWRYIPSTGIPGSIAAAAEVELRYVGHYHK